jgi:CRP/FNR family transcriptional regulator, cyclic AMP receptor protein
LSEALQSSNGWLPGTFLARLDSALSGELLGLGSTRLVQAGEQLTCQGAPGADVYLLKAGKSGTACMKVTAVVQSGFETLLAIRMAGDVIGEGAALRDDGTRSATVTACTDVVVQAVGQQQFLRYLDRRPAAWRALCTMLSDRLDWSNRRRLDFSAYPVRVRLVRIILELVQAHGVHTELGVELGVQVSQEELGKLIGAKVDAVGRAMSELRAEGLISCRYRCMRIHDLAALRRVADED